MKILIIGEVCEDIFIYGNAQRMSGEAPVPVFIPTKITKNNGMAGNTYNNVKSLKNDAIIHLIRQNCYISKTRYIDEKFNHMFLRVDEGENEIEKFNLSKCKIDFSIYDLLIVSDYNKGFFYDFVKVNEEEYLRNKKLIDENFNNVLITLGKNGVRFRDKHYPSPSPKETIDVSGAGDTFTTSFILKYYETNDIGNSINFANEMASIVVSKRGVVTPL